MMNDDESQMEENARARRACDSRVMISLSLFGRDVQQLFHLCPIFRVSINFAGGAGKRFGEFLRIDIQRYGCRSICFVYV